MRIFSHDTGFNILARGLESIPNTLLGWPLNSWKIKWPTLIEKGKLEI